MSSSDLKNGTESPYIRLSGWNNRISARLLAWLAASIARLGMLWQGKKRTRFEAAARFLRILARYIAQPEAARLLANPQLLKSALTETLWFTILITLVTVWTLMSVYGFVVIPILPLILLVIALSFLFTQLINLLALSGDIYQQAQDEGQRLCAYQASTATLRFAGCVLVVLSFCLVFVPAWRTWTPIELSALVLVTRTVYLARLAQLRWSALLFVQGEDEGESLAESK